MAGSVVSHRASRRLDSNTPTLSCSISWARNTCSVLLAKGLSSTPTPRATPGRGRGQALPADVEVRPGLGLGVADLAVGLEQEAVASRQDGTLSRPLSAQ